MNAIIKAKDLSKEYGDNLAVNNVSFDIAQGECVGLLGPNGAGKTTLLRMITCLLTPTRGQVSIAGDDVMEASLAVRKKIGFLPETPPLYGEMAVRNFLHFAASLRGVPASLCDGRVADVARRCQIGNVLDQRIDTLSLGYKKRVGIAQTIVHDPPVVILDEPITGLDPGQIVEIRELIRELKGKHTILLSSHILHEISETCDRILVMKEGIIKYQGTEADFITQHGGGRREVRLGIRGDFAKIEPLLKKIQGVKSVHKKEDTASTPGLVDLMVTTEREIREVLAREIVSAGCGLLWLDEIKSDLETAFLQLIGDREEKP